VLENRSSTAAAPSRSRPLGAELPKRQRARRTNNPLADVDLNSARGRRVADLLGAFLLAMGGPTDPLRQADALRAAELIVASEQARARLLAGEGDADVVVRLEGASSRAVRRLGLGARKREQTPGAALAEHLARSHVAPESPA
jgi:hypothetical protein